MSRTLVVTVLDGDWSAQEIARALAAYNAGCNPTETRAYDMDDARGGIEQNYRPDEACRSCGFIDGGCGDGYDENGHCTSCREAMGRLHPFQFEGESAVECASCGAPHEGQAACDVFTDQQLLEATAWCPDCHWPAFDYSAGIPKPAQAELFE